MRDGVGDGEQTFNSQEHITIKRGQDPSGQISIPVVILCSMFSSHLHSSCLQPRRWCPCVCPPTCVQHKCSNQARMQVVLSPCSPFLFLCPLTKSSPCNHCRDIGNMTQIVEILPSSSSLFQVPCDLPESSLPITSDLYLFLSWPHTSLYQYLHSPPSAPTKFPQLKTLFDQCLFKFLTFSQECLRVCM